MAVPTKELYTWSQGSLSQKPKPQGKDAAKQDKKQNGGDSQEERAGSDKFQTRLDRLPDANLRLEN